MHYLTNLATDVEELLQLAHQSQYRSERLAALLKLSPRTLRRRFRSRFGLSPQEWLNQVRLCRIAQSARAEQPLKTLASDLHFADVSHLQHYVHAKTGMTVVHFANSAIAHALVTSHLAASVILSAVDYSI